MSGRRLRIGIDAHAIGKRQTGNERFTVNLIRGLREISDHELVLFLSRPEAAADWAEREGVLVRLMRPDNPAARLLWHLPRGTRRDGLHALVAQYVAPPRTACPVLTVVHDVAFAVLPEHTPPFQRAWTRRLIPASMRRSAGVVTVSAFSRAEIERVYGIPPTRITVAPNAVDPAFRRPPLVPAPVEGPFVLTVGNLQPRKNLSTLVRAWRTLARERPSTTERLVIVGQPAYATDELMSEARDLATEGRIVFTGYLSDAELAALMHTATVFAYPSVYEGFGLPLIEAMACGVPVIASDIPVTREVVADAAVLVPPDRPEAWAAALARLLADPARRAALGIRGRERSAGFTPEASAAPVLETIERVVSATYGAHG